MGLDHGEITTVSDDHSTTPGSTSGPDPTTAAGAGDQGEPGGQPEYLQQGAGTPVPPSDHGAAGGSARRGVLIGGAVVGAVALAGAGAWAALTLVGGGPQPTEALPADTLGFVSIDLDPSAGQKIEAMKMLNKFPGFKDEFGLDPSDDLREAIFDNAFESGSCTGMSYADDVAPWIGNRAAVAGVNGTDGKPAPVVVLQVSDEGKAETGLAALADCSSEDSMAFVVDGGWAVMAEDADIAQGVVDDAAAGSLADDATYQQWMDRVGDPGVISMYVSPDAAQAFYDAMGEEAAGMSGLDLGGSLAEFQGMAGTVRFNDGALELEAASAAVEGAQTDPAAGELAAGLPADTAALVSFSVPDGWLEKIADRLAEIQGEGTGRELLDELSAETGLDLPADFETLTGDAVALSLGSDIDLDALSNSSDLSGLPVGVTIKGDAEGIQDVLDKLSSQLGPEADLLAMDADGDVVALGPSADYRAALLGDGGLGDAATFADAVPQGDGSTMVVFVNFDAGDGWLDKLAESDPSVAENLEPLSSLGMSGWVEGDTSHVVVKLTTD